MVQGKNCPKFGGVTYQSKFAPNLGELLGKKEWNGKSKAAHTVKCVKKCNYKIKVCVLPFNKKKAECKKGASNRVGNKKKKG